MNKIVLEWIDGKRILFLAKYAPLIESPISYKSTDRPYSSVYHHEIYNLLNELPAVITSSRDPNFLLESNDEFDFVFSLYNKVPCKNGEIFISSVCEYKNIPYIGANPNMRCLAEDKYLSKIVVCEGGVTVPDGVRYSNNTPPAFNGPYFVKPRYGGASENITSDSVQKSWPSAVNVANKLKAQGVECIIEKYISGINVTLPIQGGKYKNIFPPVLIPSTSLHNLITEDDKFSTSNSHSYHFYEGKLKGKLLEYGALLIDLLDDFDYARADFRIDEAKGEVYFLEINLGCDISSMGSFCFSASRIGLSQKKIVTNAIEAGLMRAGIISI